MLFGYIGIAVQNMLELHRSVFFHFILFAHSIHVRDTYSKIFPYEKLFPLSSLHSH